MFFADKKVTTKDTDIIPPKLKKNSKFDPQINNSSLEVFQNVVTIEVMNQWEKNMNSTKRRNNLSLEERKALKHLSTDTTIITKKADKGGGTVLINREDYIEEAHKQ